MNQLFNNQREKIARIIDEPLVGLADLARPRQQRVVSHGDLGLRRHAQKLRAPKQQPLPRRLALSRAHTHKLPERRRQQPERLFDRAGLAHDPNHLLLPTLSG